jgi:hypothetical protein
VTALLPLALLLSTSARADGVELSITGVGWDVPAQLESDVRAALDRVHAFDEEVLGLDLPATVTLRVRVFADRAAYDRLAATHGFGAHETLGFFDAREGGVLWRNTDTDALRATLVHEASHYLLALAGVRPAPWLNEGLAELFERFRVQGNAVWADPDPAVVAWLHALGARRPSLEALLGASDAFWSSGQGPLGKAWYTLGWSLCAFLSSSEPGKATLGAVLRGGLAGGNVGALAAIDATWPGGLAQAELAWQRWAAGEPRAIALATRASRAAEVRPTAERDPCPGGVLLRKGDQDVCLR